MILSDFLSRQKHNNSNPHEIIPIPFNMTSILHNRYYNVGNLEKYLVHTQSQAQSSGIKLLEVHGVNKCLNLNMQPEKQIIKPAIKTKVRTMGEQDEDTNKTQITHTIAQSLKQLCKLPEVPKSQNEVIT